MPKLWTRMTAVMATAVLGLSSLGLTAPQAVADDCAAATQVSLFTYNDFH